jgi:hypothetical protein
MKTKALGIIAMITASAFMLTQCQTEEAVGKEKKDQFVIKSNRGIADGNYVVDDNHLIKSTSEISPVDMERLLALDSKYADLLRGKAFLHYIVNTQQIKFLTKVRYFDKISRINKINFIHKGCFETAQIDWNEFKDLKRQLDRILYKYSPELINGNVSISNNQIATKAVKIDDNHMSNLFDITKFGYDDANICGDYMGVNRFSRLLNKVNNVGPNEELTIRLDEIINKY